MTNYFSRRTRERNKYNARAVTVDGRRFDSQAEYRRWQELD